MAEDGLYSILGLTPSATAAEIDSAYERLLAAENAAEPLTPTQRDAIEQAHATLSDPLRRLRYDAAATAPPEPRFQMPYLALPHWRFHVPRPVVVGAGIFALLVAFLFLMTVIARSKPKLSLPVQSVATQTATPEPTAKATPGPTVSSPLLVTGILAGVQTVVPPLPTAVPGVGGPSLPSATTGPAPRPATANPPGGGAASTSAAPPPVQGVPISPQTSAPPQFAPAVNATAVGAAPTPAPTQTGPINHIFVPTSPVRSGTGGR